MDSTPGKLKLNDGSTKSARGSKKAGGRSKRNESENTIISKSMSYILRHGAEKEGLKMRADGFVRVEDLLSRPKLKKLNCNLHKIEEIVAADAKQRYQLVFEKETNSADVFEGSSENKNLPVGAWWIRANQGHSLPVAELELVEIMSSDEVPVAVHGTSMAAWNSINLRGLSRMNRNHIHMAKGLPESGIISGMRQSATVHIYVDVEKAMSQGIKFYLSANEVILCPGNQEGYIAPELFKTVSARFGNKIKRWNGSDWEVEEVVS